MNPEDLIGSDLQARPGISSWDISGVGGE